MKKVLSVALAMVFALSSAALVSAQGLTKEGHAYLANLGVKVEEKKAPALYESWSSKKEYEALKEQLVKADKDLKQDSMEWAKLQTIACEALRLTKETQHELASVETLKKVANETVYVEFPAFTDGETQYEVQELFMTEADWKKVVKLSDENDKYAAMAPTDVVEKAVDPSVVLGVKLNDGKEAVTALDMVKSTAKQLLKIKEMVTVEGYQDGRGYAFDNYRDEVANFTTADLQADLKYLNGVVKFVGEVAAKTGLKFEKCALPADMTPAPAAKAEAKKDMVPNTAAAFGCAF